ncbi:MAG: enoyl-CoA hydratase/isomerase family protein [Cumulibacter sp.]
MQHFTLATADNVATLTFDNPPINLMTGESHLELADILDDIAADDNVHVLVLRSANPEWFIAHFDVAAILTMPTDAGDPPTELTRYHQMCEQLRLMPKATIAVIDGRVGGGGNEIAMSCDMRFASPAAVFNQPEVALGIIPGGSGTARLPRLVGRARALETILGCEDIDADTAERWGLVNRVVPADHLEAHVNRLAKRIAAFPPHAVAAAKASVTSAESAVTEHLLAESHAFSRTLGEPRARAAMEEFLATGGQTPEGERRLGELAGELSE